MKTCSPRTGLYGLIGSPVGHSLSPVIHCLLYKRYGVDAVYLVWDTGVEELAARIEALRQLARGFNVTTPLKEHILSFLDNASREAVEIGAVNTVKNHGGRLVGYNTDYLGVAKCLEKWRAGHVLVLGAGGAARAAIYALHLLGAEKITVANRGKERAEKLRKWAKRLGIDLETLGLSKAADPAKRADVIINATPLGSKACCPQEAPPVLNSLHQGQVVLDMVYAPLETRLLREARRRGAATVTGLCMLIWQALYADKIWLGIEPSIDDYNYIEGEVTRLLAREAQSNRPA